jgi:hypothetical protein
MGTDSKPTRWETFEAFEELLTVNDGEEFVALLSRLQNVDIYRSIFSTSKEMRHKVLRNFPRPVRDALGYVIDDHRGGCSREESEDSQARVVAVANILKWYLKSLDPFELEAFLSRPISRKHPHEIEIESLRGKTEEDLLNSFLTYTSNQMSAKGSDDDLFTSECHFGISKGPKGYSFVTHRNTNEIPKSANDGHMADISHLNYAYLYKEVDEVRLEYRLANEFGIFRLDKTGRFKPLIKKDARGANGTFGQGKLIRIAVDEPKPVEANNSFSELTSQGVTKIAGEVKKIQAAPQKPIKKRRRSGPIG